MNIQTAKYKFLFGCMFLSFSTSYASETDLSISDVSLKINSINDENSEFKNKENRRNLLKTVGSICIAANSYAGLTKGAGTVNRLSGYRISGIFADATRTFPGMTRHTEGYQQYLPALTIAGCAILTYSYLVTAEAYETERALKQEAESLLAKLAAEKTSLAKSLTSAENKLGKAVHENQSLAETLALITPAYEAYKNAEAAAEAAANAALDSINTATADVENAINELAQDAVDATKKEAVQLKSKALADAKLLAHQAQVAFNTIKQNGQGIVDFVNKTEETLKKKIKATLFKEKVTTWNPSGLKNPFSKLLKVLGLKSKKNDKPVEENKDKSKVVEEEETKTA